MLEDIEALYLLLSSADKNKEIIILMSDVTKRKHFLLKHSVDFYEL